MATRELEIGLTSEKPGTSLENRPGARYLSENTSNSYDIEAKITNHRKYTFGSC